MTTSAERLGGPRCASLLELIGNTPALRVDTPLPKRHPGFWAKLEGLAPGSMKARAALAMLTGARDRGQLGPGGTVVESSSGTLGIGLAYVGALLGHPVVIVADQELDPMTRALLCAYGARVEIVHRPHPVGGWQRARLEVVRRLLAGLPEAYWPDQYNNPDNPEGYRGLGRELVEQFDELDAVVCSVGTGGHSAGIAAVLRERWPAVRIIGVDTPGSTVFGQQAGRRLMRGLGSSIHPDNVAYRAFDEVHWVGPAETVDACRRLARDTFVTGGWSTGAAALVAAWHARKAGTDRVVAVFPDGPHRYWDTIYDDEFCRGHGLIPATITEPSEVDGPSAATGYWSRCRTVSDPCGRRGDPPATCDVCAREVDR
ncbi:MAG: pyridoxal-phosphate dependent enzyme [Pseudonocardiaceae bacterium]|nr:pyridoxal-phosphate dependent enzyme [Pseudonocardiaceae bacterium]